MTSYTITNTRSGFDLGTYKGETALHAIAAFHRDAGYRADVVDGELVTDAPEADLSALKATEAK